jgi:acetylornithine/LysW-gamma-L-lysine aminotransferase
MRGFHGRTMGSLSATWEKKYREPFEPLVPGFHHVPYNQPEALAEAITDQTAAVLLEVVQGEGGVRPGTPQFLETAQRLCRDRGALLILDEVQTGFCRTGRWFGFHHYGLEPDLVALAKALGGGVPIGACAIGSRVGELPKHVHGSTFGGNPLAAAAALAAITVMENEGLADRARDLGAYALERLRAIEAPVIREVRGLGLMLGVECKGKVAPFLRSLMERGILALPAGDTVLRFLPPLVITEEEIDRVVAETAQVLKAA